MPAVSFIQSFRWPPGARRAAVLPLALATLALGACGGGSDPDPPVDIPRAEPPPALVRDLEGDWVQQGCVRAGAQSFKKVLRARTSSQATLDYDEGVLTFGSTDCAGASQLSGPTRLGSVAFARSDSSPALAAHWGELRTITGTRLGTIWTLRTGNLLCLLGDGIPSIQPTLAAVAASVATLPTDNCFSR